jgi:6-pyruvoyltetrahydropterin/6-carboxytetrahydropterin synthase
MYTIFKDFTFSAAHAIRGHTRGCQNLHGHNYRVRVINDIPPFDQRNTTAELFSEYVFAEVARRLADQERVRVTRVEVWENDTACAVYEA